MPSLCEESTTVVVLEGLPEVFCFVADFQGIHDKMASGQIHYLNAHGTSSPLGDITEIKAVKRVFKESLSQLWINSGKSLTGHCLSSAGVIECIASIIQMQEGFIHPNLNLENPIDSECRLSGRQAEIVSIDTAMSNSFGFGGINSSIILKKGD